MIEVPKVDGRTGEDVAREIYALLRLNRLHGDQLKGRLDAALVKIFGRFSEEVIDRLNKSPEKKFLAFLDLLGVSPLPLQAATVPLTFYLVPKAASHAVVHAGTRVAASPAKGNQKPVIFETQSELVVTSTQLDSLFLKNGRDEYADLGSALLSSSPAGQQVMLPETAIEVAFRTIPHVLYISVPGNPAWQSIDRLNLQIVVDNPQPLTACTRAIQWEIGSGVIGLDHDPEQRREVVSPEIDTTQNLTTTGTIGFKSLPAIPVSLVSGMPSYWLCCRLCTPLNTHVGADIGMSNGPASFITSVIAESENARTGLPVEHAFYEKQALDVTKDFFPFGQRPRLGDALYIGNREAFSEQGATITIHVDVANSQTSASGPGSTPEITPHPELSWELWDGQAWRVLNERTRSLRLGKEDSEAANSTGITPFSDETQSLSRSGIVTLTSNRVPAELNLNGIKNHWLRVRISAGDYGKEVQVQRDDKTGALTALPATLAPPCIRSLKIDYSVKKESKPSIIQLNEWDVTRVAPDSPFRPFESPISRNAVPSQYFGFKTMGSETPNSNPMAMISQGKGEGLFPHFPVNVYVLIDERSNLAHGDDPAPSAAAWEYWNGASWKRFTVADETQSLRKSGLLAFLLPGDFVQSSEFGRRRYWLRMRLSESTIPQIRSMLQNTVTAVQGMTISNEILGGSNGEPNQKFRTTYPSVLAGQRLEVCEPTHPSHVEEELLLGYADSGSSIQPTVGKSGKTEFWIMWHEVNSFYGSGPRDRHYIFDHITGEVLFGDGVCGMIPPILAGNIRMKHYRTGGGTIGNQPAQSIKQLVSAVPYVQKVVNWVPAVGGSDSEPIDAVLERGPREVRHRGRAVTIEDFEDLALRASREVARTRCVPQCNLANDPNATRRRPGLISVIVVPRSIDSKPVPSVDLLEHVKGYLDARRLATAELVVVSPEYVRVDVEAEIVVNRPEEASFVEQKVEAALKSYLHPLWGGPTRSGWEFGRLPRRSDLYVLIERIPGVSHIQNLGLTIMSEHPGAEKSKHFLVYCGQNKLTMTL